MVKDTSSPAGPFAMSVTAHLTLLLLAVWLSPASPAHVPQAAAVNAAQPLPIYEQPVAHDEPLLKPVKAVVRDADIAIKRVEKRGPPHKPAAQKPVLSPVVLNSVKRQEPPVKFEDPFSVRAAQANASPKSSFAAANGLSDAYRRQIAEAIHRNLRGRVDDAPDKGVLLALTVDVGSGRVLRARIEGSSGHVSWDNRAQSAAMQTVVPSGPDGCRPPQLRINVHP
jgi:hypothetical protein